MGEETFTFTTNKNLYGGTQSFYTPQVENKHCYALRNMVLSSGYQNGISIGGLSTKVVCICHGSVNEQPLDDVLRFFTNIV